jgi:hypothetical protein
LSDGRLLRTTNGIDFALITLESEPVSDYPTSTTSISHDGTRFWLLGSDGKSHLYSYDGQSWTQHFKTSIQMRWAPSFVNGYWMSHVSSTPIYDLSTYLAASSPEYIGITTSSLNSGHRGYVRIK